jgi:hypothetical protein
MEASVTLTPQLLYSQQKSSPPLTHPTATEQDAGWAPDPVWSWLRYTSGTFQV